MQKMQEKQKGAEMSTKKYQDIWLKYQKNNPKYWAYRKKYEKEYREKNRILWNLKSWKSIKRANGKRITPIMEIDYLLKRILKEELDKS